MGNVKGRARNREMYGKRERTTKGREGGGGKRENESESGRTLLWVGIEFAKDLHFVLCNSCGHVVRRLLR